MPLFVCALVFFFFFFEWEKGVRGGVIGGRGGGEGEGNYRFHSRG